MKYLTLFMYLSFGLLHFINAQNVIIYQVSAEFRPTQEKDLKKFAPTVILPVNQDSVAVKPIILGKVSLFTKKNTTKLVHKLNRKVGRVNEPKTNEYWIGKDLFEPITHTNYKSIIPKFLPEAKFLHKKLGQVGFRFENIPSMILYYNRFFSEESSEELENLPVHLLIE